MQTGSAAVRDVIAETCASLRPLNTADETAAFIQSSKRHVYRLIAAGRLHAVRKGSSRTSPLLIPRASIERYLASQMEG